MTASTAACSLEYFPGAPGEVEVRVSVLDIALLGQRAQFYVEAEADVTSPETPIHARRVLFSTEFEICDSMAPIQVPIRALEMCLYQGTVVTIGLFGTLAIDSEPVLEKAIDLASLRLEVLKPAFGEGTFEFSQKGTIGEMFKSAKETLNRYANISLIPISDTAREQRKIHMRELFEGEASIDLEDCTLQLVAWNTENGQHEIPVVNGNADGTVGGSEIVHIGKPVRWKIVFEKHLPKILKGEAIQDYLDDTLHFSELFAAHCPPLRVTNFHRIRFYMEAKLIHPERHTTHSESLGRDFSINGVNDFLFEDFFEPV